MALVGLFTSSSFFVLFLFAQRPLSAEDLDLELQHFESNPASSPDSVHDQLDKAANSVAAQSASTSPLTSASSPDAVAYFSPMSIVSPQSATASDEYVRVTVGF
jgi:hypothetical protein